MTILIRLLCKQIRKVGARVTSDNANQHMAKVLLVEDESRLQDILARTLSRSGYDVHTASTASEAVKQAQENRPDVMVLDVNLPDGTGWGVLRHLAAQGVSCQSLPTIVLSAGQPAHSRIEEFRPFAFLAKPFPVDTLIRLIAEALVLPATVSGSEASDTSKE